MRRAQIAKTKVGVTSPIDLSKCINKETIDRELSDLFDFKAIRNSLYFLTLTELEINGDAPSLELFHYFWKSLTSKLSSSPKDFEDVKIVTVNRSNILMNDTIAQSLFDYSLLFNQNIPVFKKFKICNSKLSFSNLALFVSSSLDENYLSKILTLNGDSYLEIIQCKINNKINTLCSHWMEIDSAGAKSCKVAFIQSDDGNDSEDNDDNVFDSDTNDDDNNKQTLNLQDIQEMFQELQSDTDAQYLIQNAETSLHFSRSHLTLDAFHYLVPFFSKSDNVDKSTGLRVLIPSLFECTIIPSFNDNSNESELELNGVFSAGGLGIQVTSMRNCIIDSNEKANFLLQVLEPVLKQLKNDGTLNLWSCNFHMSTLQTIFSNLDILNNVGFKRCFFHDDKATPEAIDTDAEINTTPVDDIIWTKTENNGALLQVHDDDEHIHSIEAIMKLLVKYPPFVTTSHLDFCESNVSDMEVKCIAKYLNQTNIQNVIFSRNGRCKVTNVGLKSLAIALQTNTQVCQLDLSQNVGIITSAGLEHFVKVVFKHNTSLKYMPVFPRKGVESIDNDNEMLDYRTRMDQLQFHLALNRLGHVHVSDETLPLVLFPLVLKRAKDDPSVIHWTLQTCVNHLLLAKSAATTSCITGQKRKGPE